MVFTHQFNHEYKFFQFTQSTPSDRFGDRFSSSINNKTRYNHLYNKVGVAYKTKNYGDLEFLLMIINIIIIIIVLFMIQVGIYRFLMLFQIELII